MIEACPTCLGYMFSKIQATAVCRILHQHFWLIQMDLCLDLELGMGNYLRIFLAEVWSQTKIKLQLRPCHPGRHGHYTMLQLLKRCLTVAN